ncbi:DEAD/DEAH box helicase [Taylorella asinigenitalis]|uniref:DEAD/DEAH box helicase n=1 Tax=Taylorella asinigenitalis TaxID=84590 RepID=UPI00048C2C5B|nr:AAA domain-containing protein [Taylorella asinigenitalis]
MSNKNKILDSWILVEQLSEGEIKPKEYESHSKFDFSHSKLEDYDYFDLFTQKINVTKGDEHLLALYLNYIKFEELNKILKLVPSEEAYKFDRKFSIAIYFDKELKLMTKEIFVTVSSFIKNKNAIPSIKDFQDYENNIKQSISSLFPNENIVNYREVFNEGIKNLFKNFLVDKVNSGFKVYSSLEREKSNLHSFFIKDLQKAKVLSTRNLDNYLIDNLDARLRHRVNLVTKVESDDFNKKTIRAFLKILQPKNYPISRFPSSPKYALSLMQQVAVNLSVHDDSNTIRSVNGPPGTGKTTLLKDIFAHLVVEQAKEICSLSNKKIEGTETTKYSDTKSIGVLQKQISDRGIVVASSNNGAVKNIVDELPKIESIADEFREAILQVDYFKDVANSKENSDNDRCEQINSKGCKNWGLFSKEGGKKANINQILSALDGVIKDLKNNPNPNSNVYEEFRNHLKEINEFIVKKQKEFEHLKKQKFFSKDILKQFHNEGIKLENPGSIVNKAIVCKTELEKVRENIAKEREAFKLKNLPQPKWYDFWSNERKELNNLKSEHNKKLKPLKKQEQELLTRFNYLKQVHKIASEANKTILDFTDGYESLHLSNPWFDAKFREMQSNLFISALKVRKQFLLENVDNLEAAHCIWKEQLYKPKSKFMNDAVITQAWNWINLTIPVISTTFASVSTMFKNLDNEVIGNLFIDEAGQALPQASVGAIFRSKRVLAVGDPAQIKPVLTLDPVILEMIREKFNEVKPEIPKTYLSENSSTQTLIDRISKYGFYKNKKDDNWIGIPLWVHRRCKSPMFEISNQVSYDGNMVQGKTGDIRGKAEWYDVTGSADDKYVEEQGECLVKKLKYLEDNKKFFVISPFKNVAQRLIERLDSEGFVRRDKNGKVTNIGTVHTFQGKEAPIVFLVLGADEESKEAAKWAMGKDHPNIMNVAATRAKEEFYIIGNKKLYQGLESTVVDTAIEKIEEFNIQNK